MDSNNQNTENAGVLHFHMFVTNQESMGDCWLSRCGGHTKILAFAGTYTGAEALAIVGSGSEYFPVAVPLAKVIQAIADEMARAFLNGLQDALAAEVRRVVEEVMQRRAKELAAGLVLP